MSDHYKYPKTWHVPGSRGIDEDDRMHTDLFHFEGREVVVTEKMDGECTGLYRDYIHARSINSGSHPSRDFVKSMWGSFRYLIPETWRLYGENMYATHSIHYTELKSYLYLFSIWEDQMCFHWQGVKDFAKVIGIPTVPEIYIGYYYDGLIEEIVSSLDLEKQEGIAIRTVGAFYLEEFPYKVNKWVRPKHITTDEHWMNKPIVPNELRRYK